MQRCWSIRSDEAAIASALRDLIENPDRRADLRVKGIERARQFSWQQTARLTLQAYERARLKR